MIFDTAIRVNIRIVISFFTVWIFGFSLLLDLSIASCRLILTGWWAARHRSGGGGPRGGPPGDGDEPEYVRAVHVGEGAAERRRSSRTLWWRSVCRAVAVNGLIVRVGQVLMAALAVGLEEVAVDRRAAVLDMADQLLESRRVSCQGGML